MIIDAHGHIVMPEEMYRFMGDLTGSRANPGSRTAKVQRDLLRRTAEENIAKLDSVGTDLQFLSPRPYIQMHSIRPPAVTSIWTRYVNNAIFEQVQMFPNRFRGIAGLPQFRKESPGNCLEELERCVKELGFVGCILNPDPTEGEESPPPGLGDPFWYPLYEKLVELDVPALVHSASSCHPRESYTLKFINEESIAIISLLESRVFQDFPTLKIVISHGGGAIPYHMGRFRAWNLRRGESEPFDLKMRRLYFDTCNYSREALEFQFQVLGTDNCLFGTERPGTGSVHNPTTGADFDHLRPIIEAIPWLSAEDRYKIFEGNCRKIYTRAFK
jgi:4-oxalmesaconate hydratase